MDKLNFFENLEPYDETQEAASLLVELASAPDLIEKRPAEIIKPPAGYKDISVSSKISVPPVEIEESDEEIVTARVEPEEPEPSLASFPEPIEPVFDEEEKERFSADSALYEPSMAIAEAPSIAEESEQETPLLMHTIESQQQYAREIETDQHEDKKAGKMTVEDFYYGEGQEPAKFEDQMVIEHTLPKVNFEEYLKSEDDRIPLPTPPAFEPPAVKDKIEVKPDLSTERAEMSPEEVPGGVESEEASKLVLDLPHEAAPPAEDEFFMIDQASLPETEAEFQKFEEEGGKIETAEAKDSEHIEDSFKDTDSYKIPGVEEKTPAVKKAGGPYTEITLMGEIPEEEPYQPARDGEIAVSSAPVILSEEAAETEGSEHEDTLEPSEESAESITLEKEKEPAEEESANITLFKELKTEEAEEAVSEEKTEKEIPYKKEISLESLREKEEHFKALTKVEKPGAPEEEKDVVIGEAEKSKAKPAGGAEIKELIKTESSPDVKSSVEIKEKEIPTLKPIDEKKSEKEESLPPLLPFETSKIKSVFKDSKKFQSSELPPFESAKQTSNAEKFESFEEKQKPEVTEHVVKKETEKNKEEIEDYDKILKEAQKEADEFIKETIKKKQENGITSTGEPEKEGDSIAKQPETQSFSDFLAKVKSQDAGEDLQSGKPDDSKPAPPSSYDHPLRPSLETPHVPEDIAQQLPIVKPDSSERGRLDFTLKPTSSEIEDLKYRSVPLSSEDKETPAKEPKLKSIFSKLLKKKEKEDKIE